jgi:signal transduction histidine kinase
MSRIFLLLAAALLFGLSIAAGRAAPPADAKPAEADLHVLLDTIRANRKALVTVNLTLTDEEAAKFWPLYDRYQQEINAVGDRLAAIIADYTANFRDLSNDKALQLVEDYLAAEADRVQIRRSYISQFAKILPGRTVARFYQIENKMDAVIRYDLASTIPVVDETSGVPAQ